MTAALNNWRARFLDSIGGFSDGGGVYEALCLGAYVSDVRCW